MPTAAFGNDPLKVEGYRRFWGLADARRPLVGFTMRGFFPMEEYAVTRAWLAGTFLRPETNAVTYVHDSICILKDSNLVIAET